MFKIINTNKLKRKKIVLLELIPKAALVFVAVHVCLFIRLPRVEIRPPSNKFKLKLT